MSVITILNLPLGDVKYTGSRQFTETEMQLRYIYDILEEYASNEHDVEGTVLSSDGLRIYDMLKFNGSLRTIFFKTNFSYKADEHGVNIPYCTEGLSNRQYEMTIDPEGNIKLCIAHKEADFKEISALAIVFNYMYY